MLGRTLALWREMIAEQWEYRELLQRLTGRDVLIRYKQTFMGFGWAIFMPLVNTAVFSVIFARIAEVRTPVPYPVFAFCGLWAWNYFASSLRFSVTSLTSNATLVSKVYFPREIFPFSAIGVQLVDFAVGAVVLIALMVWYQVAPGWHILWLPLVLAVHVCFTAAVALLLSMANLFYRDVKYLFEVLITVWMFSSSVIYPLDGIGGTTGLLLHLNPMTAILDAYRNVLLIGTPPAWPFFAATATSLGSLLICWQLFHRFEFQFAERI